MPHPHSEKLPTVSHALASSLVRHGPSPDLSVFREEEAGPVAESLTLASVSLLTSTSWGGSQVSVTRASLCAFLRLRLDDRLARQTGFHLRHVGSPEYLGKCEAFLQMLY
jgi:hypothetical protein